MLARRACKLTKEAAILWNVQTNPQEETLTQWLTIGILCGNSKAVYSMSFSPTTAGENLQQTKTCSVRQGLQFFSFFSLHFVLHLFFPFFLLFFSSLPFPRESIAVGRNVQNTSRNIIRFQVYWGSQPICLWRTSGSARVAWMKYRQQLGLGLEVAEGFSVSISLAIVRCISGSFFLSNVLFLLVWRVGLVSCISARPRTMKIPRQLEIEGE